MGPMQSQNLKNPGPWILAAVALAVLYAVTRPHLVTTYSVRDEAGATVSGEPSLVTCESMVTYHNQHLQKSDPANLFNDPEDSKRQTCASQVTLVWGW